MIKDLSEEEFQQIRQYKSIANRGRLVSAKAVTDLFNKVFNASAKPVSCATCIRNRIFKMYKELEKYEKEQEELKKQEALEALETHVRQEDQKRKRRLKNEKQKHTIKDRNESIG